MDPLAWSIGGVSVIATAALIAAAPALHRAQRRRQEHGEATGYAGVGAGFDSVWRPSAEEAHTEWDASVRAPAPAPAPGDKGRITDGRIVIAPQRHRAD